MSSECPTEILPPDSMHLSAATGWMQLGNTDEALVAVTYTHLTLPTILLV